TAPPEGRRPVPHGPDPPPPASAAHPDEAEAGRAGLLPPPGPAAHPHLAEQRGGGREAHRAALLRAPEQPDDPQPGELQPGHSRRSAAGPPSLLRAAVAPATKQLPHR